MIIPSTRAAFLSAGRIHCRGWDPMNVSSSFASMTAKPSEFNTLLLTDWVAHSLGR